MKILFVCLGNICRSPMAEAVLRHLAAERGIADRIHVDSAGTGAWHAGETADPRTIATLQRQGIVCPGQARQLTTQDFTDFDLIVAMDDQNLRDITRWPGARKEKVRIFTEGGIGDPYYGGPRGFDSMYYQIDEGCRAILAEIETRLSK